MQKLIIALCMCGAVTIGSPSVALADYKDGIAAYQRGDYATALNVWKPQAEQGNAKAQFLLASMYLGGQGVPQNVTEAAKWLRLSAAQAFDSAQSLLGRLYADGVGVSQNFTEAVKWYRLAAEQGNAGAQYSLGVAYKKGQGVPQDIAEAVKWYRKAAEQNDVKAQSQVGTLLLVMYAAKGQDVPLPVEAIKWFRRAAENGDVGSQTILGGIYETGALVTKDYVQAYMWFNIAAGNGDVNGRKGRDILEKRMTATDISKAQKLTKEWMKKHPQQK